MGSVKWFMVMGLGILDTGSKVKSMAKEHSVIRMDLSRKAHGKTE